MPNPTEHYSKWYDMSYQQIAYGRYQDDYKKWLLGQKNEVKPLYHCGTLVALISAQGYLGKIVNHATHDATFYEVHAVHILDGVSHGVHKITRDDVCVADIDKLAEEYGISRVAKAILKL